MSGPLASLKVVEFSGLGPAPLAGQLLADLGAEVIVIDRRSAPADPTDINRRGKKSIALDLKKEAGLTVAKAMIAQADILIEGYRPGVMERLGLGPDVCPDTLVYGRMTGWGQDGPWSHTAGHDINYLSLTGALHAIGPADRPPVVPLNLVADFGGGTMFLIFGLLSAIIERNVSGKGQVVDAAMVDGVPAMMGLIHGLQAQGKWGTQRESNWLDGAAPFYRCYECADGKFISVGALEPQFFEELLEIAEIPHPGPKAQHNSSRWPSDCATFAEIFKTRSRAEWEKLFQGTDACVAPVLDYKEAPNHQQNAKREVFFKDQDVSQASPAPRFSRSTPQRPTSPGALGGDANAILTSLGYDTDAIQKMRENGLLT